ARKGRDSPNGRFGPPLRTAFKRLTIHSKNRAVITRERVENPVTQWVRRAFACLCQTLTHGRRHRGTRPARRGGKPPFRNEPAPDGDYPLGSRRSWRVP